MEQMATSGYSGLHAHVDLNLPIQFHLKIVQFVLSKTSPWHQQNTSGDNQEILFQGILLISN